jgi:hypothetical protein
MKQTIINRIKEPSTWTAVSVICIFFGVPAGVPELLQQVVVGVAGLAGVLLPENKG